MARQFVQEIIYLQGDDADEAFKILYPDWSDGLTGWATTESTLAMLEHLKQWDYGEPTETYLWEGIGPGVDMYRTRYYIMTWDFGHGWVSLKRRITIKEVKEREPHLLAG